MRVVYTVDISYSPSACLIDQSFDSMLRSSLAKDIHLLRAIYSYNQISFAFALAVCLIDVLAKVLFGFLDLDQNQ